MTQPLSIVDWLPFQRSLPRLAGLLGVWLALAGGAFGATTLTVRELELQGGTNATVPVEFRSDAAVAAVQMDVLFDPAAYTAASAAPGALAESFRVDSHLVEAGRLRVVVGAASNAALPNGIVFRVPLTAVDDFAAMFPIALTNFQLSTATGANVPAKAGFIPHVRLTNLTGNARINGQGGVALEVEASAVDGSVARVEFFAGGQKIGESTAAPFRIIWTPPGSGPFVIQAVVFDSDGFQANSQSIPIVITNLGTTAVKGLYAGLVQDDPFAFGTAGYVQFATTATGKFTAKLMVGGATYSQRGRFNGEGIASVRFARGRNKTPLTLTLQQFATDVIDQIEGQLTDGTFNGAVIENASFVADVLADRSIWKAGIREPSQKGRYTIVLAAAEDAVARHAPLGDGVGTVRVRKDGSITSSFILADGTKTAQGTFLSKDGVWHAFASLQRDKGVLLGDLDFTPQPGVSDFDGTLNWSRPAKAHAAAFKDGFNTSLDALGSRYEIPERFERVLNVANVAGNVRFVADGGGLPEPFVQLMTLSSTNTLRPVTSGFGKFTFQLTADTGLFAGTFIHPETGKDRAFRGVAFQRQNLGTGFFRGGELGGGLTLDPNPNFAQPPESHPQAVESLPTLTIQEPKNGARIVSPAPLIFSGKAKANQPVLKVSYQLLYDGMLSPIVEAEGTKNWMIDLTPDPKAGGFYKVFAKARDAGGEESDVVARTVFYVVESPLVVTHSGSGTFTPGFGGTTVREIGATYTIKAKPFTGHTFLGWTGSVTSSAETITFTMREEFTLHATFQ